MVDKNELSIILQLNDKIRYNNPKDVQTAYNWAIKEQRLKKVLGQRYIKRLKQIMDGTDLFAGCLICEKDLDNNSVICTSCLNKSRKLLRAGQETPAVQGEATINFNDVAQKVKKTTETVAKETGKAAKEVKNKLSEQMENENVKKAVDKSKKVSRSAMSFWKSLPRKARLIVTAVLVIVVAFAFLRGGGNRTENVSGGKLDRQEAQEVLEETLEKSYPGMEFQIEQVASVTQYPNVFKGEVGQSFDPANSGGETLPVFTFNVRAGEKGKNQYALAAVCMVTHDGRISARGNLISESNTSGDYRIR